MKEKERKLEEQFLGLNDHIGKSKRSLSLFDSHLIFDLMPVACWPGGTCFPEKGFSGLPK